MKILSLILAFSLSLSAIASHLDPSRPYLDRLEKRGHATFNEYVYPYLITERAERWPFSRQETLKKLMAHLKKTALPYRGHFSETGIPLDSATESKFTLPKVVVAGDQLEGIEKCNASYCKMKLNTAHEKTAMASAKDKVAEYRSLILARLRRYLQFNEVWGYENTFQNEDAVKAMIAQLRFPTADYPVSAAYLEKGFWEKKGPSAAGPIGSLLREEVVNMNLDPLQPILRVVEDLIFHERSRDFIFETHIYTDHYFDASCRAFEVWPWKADPKQSVLIVSDVMNIDELEKSSLIRMLYEGKMEGAVSDYQESELSTIRGE